ncbi:MAG TPA: NADH-quinone oxidoreductase subunit L [Gemmataceae bacterium]|nr:NADH-quinone oxidoreductase subunit L [Gemmataceae bacterium]
MSEIGTILWIIPILPLAAAVLIVFLGPRLLRGFSHVPCVLALAVSCVLSVYVLIHVARQPDELIHPTYYTWFAAGNIHIPVAFRADPLTAFMLAMVTFVGTFIAIFAAGYMHGDDGYPRFFAEVSLFVFSMTGLVLADNYMVLFAFWEGVGLCSYLLIGFWYEKPSAAHAARKAFLVTRIGDLGFILGIILLWITFGHNLDYEYVFTNAANVNRGALIAICFLLFSGAIGKSAQFPLHVWLPDAMEGPTPVSALIHAATMVTAGVYLVARSMPLYVLAPQVLLFVACIGTFTALLAAFIALTQTDLKRVLAYSTVSQLGYMFLGLGAAVYAQHSRLAVEAGMFHLFTHAFFKALLFLSAGSVMHAMGNVIDMRRFSGLRRVLPYTHIAFLCGAVALAAVPLTSGFWSKDAILTAAYNAAKEGHHYGAVFVLLFICAVITAGLTAFYTFRAYFMTFWGEERIPHEAGHHAHESPLIMVVPLMVLSVGALFAGYIDAEPFGLTWLGTFLEHVKHLPAMPTESVTATLLDRVWLLVVPLAMSLGGIAVAWLMYVRQPAWPGVVAARARALYELSWNKVHFDEIYNAFFVLPLWLFAQFCRIFDLGVVDSIVDVLGHVPRLIGGLFRPIQNGLVQFYALAMVLGLTVFLIALVNALAK